MLHDFHVKFFDSEHYNSSIAIDFVPVDGWLVSWLVEFCITLITF